MKPISEIRNEYSRGSLDVANVDPNPIVQFNKWFQEALQAEVLEPNAMTLSTVTKSGRPAARIVLLKGVEDNTFIFFTNYQSKKGNELEHNPFCSLTFFWPELERQVRIDGLCERTTPEASERYFQSRPRGSQIGAWASPQSNLIANREILESRVKEIEERFEGKEVLPKPNQWGGYAVTPLEIEFWQGRSNRLHDRIVYYFSNHQWVTHRLAP